MHADAAFREQLKAGYDTIAGISDMSYHHYPRSLVHQQDKVTLYHYTPRRKSRHATPLLIVFSTVNRPEILELQPAVSLIGGLLDKGMDVYLLDWGYPDANDYSISLNAYINHYLQDCVNQVCQQAGVSQINLLGICQGGVLSLCFALLSKQVNQLVLISTPVDFHTPDNVITKIVRKIDVSVMTSLTGNISGSLLSQFFISLRPFELMGKKYLRLLDRLSDPVWVERFLRVEKWLHDAPDQPATAFSEFIRDFYQQNKLVNHALSVGGRRIDLNRLTMPVLNIMAKGDELVPNSASSALKGLLSPQQYSQRYFAGGHIGIYINQSSVNALSTCIANWLKKYTVKSHYQITNKSI